MVKKATSLQRLVDALTVEEKNALLVQLKRSLAGILPKEVTACPCCAAVGFRKYGQRKGVQIYQCKATKKRFTFKTGTVLSGIVEVEKLAELVNMLGDGKLPTITEIETKLGVSRQTAFDWRSKILAALHVPGKLDHQILEFDELFHYLSRKGRKGMKYGRKRGSKRGVGDNKYTGKVFMSYSRSTGKLDLLVSHIGKTKATDVRNYLGLARDIVVYSDKHRSYGKFYAENGVENYTFKAADHVSAVNPEVHNQTVNAYSAQFGTLVNYLHKGVSTKYLQNYANWFGFVKNHIREGAKPVQSVMENKLALHIHKQKEQEFRYLLRNCGRSNFGQCRQRYLTAKIISPNP